MEKWLSLIDSSEKLAGKLSPKRPNDVFLSSEAFASQKVLIKNQFTESRLITAGKDEEE